VSWLLVAPIAVPFVTAVAAFALRGAPRLERAVSVGGAAALFAVSIALLAKVMAGGILAAQMGDWPAPFGITLVADRLSAAMVAITGITGLAVAVYALAEMDREREARGFHPLYHCLLAGVCGAFLTGDLFNLYVWFEVMLISSFGLLVLGGSRAEIEGGVKYVTLNILATLAFLTAVGLLYGLTGTLNMADLHLKVPQVEDQALVTTVAVLFMIAFGMKAAVFPLFFWLPASYHTPAVTVSAIFSALLTKVGVYALIRVFTLIFTGDVAFTHELLLVIAGLTMVTGVLGAACQSEIRRILSFHIVSQIGYMVMGLALFTPLALVGAVFYLIHHIIVKANLFLVGGLVKRLRGATELKSVGDLWRTHPGVALLFLVPALSLAGFPPLSGFWAKLVLVRAGIEQEAWTIVAVALVVGLFTVFSMTKIWTEAFWKPQPEGARPEGGGTALMVLPIFALAALTLLIGLAPQPFFEYAERSALELLDPAPYVRTVLEASR
jgi:multicomponent Na+:H+ antiporter subunit D